MQQAKETKYYKLLNTDLTHHRFKYQLGLNIDTEQFNRNECENGLHFCREDQIAYWFGYGENLAIVQIPQDAQVCHFPDKSKADKIHIERIIPLADWERWEDPEFCLKIIKQDGELLKYIKKQTKEMCLAAVRQDGLALQYVREQTEEICLAACRQDGLALQYVAEQTEEICLAAVKEIGLALQYVREQTEEICLAACRQDGLALQYVAEQTIEICLVAVRKDGYALQYVANQTYELCLEAAGNHAWSCYTTY